MTVALALLAALAAQTAQSTGDTPPSSSEAANTTGVGQYTYLDLEGGVGYATNPRFAFGSDTGSGSGYVSLHAVHSRITARTTTVLSAYAQETAYTSRYGSSQSLSVSAHHDASVNERLRLYVDGSAGYDQNGQLDTRIINTPNIPVLPGSPDIPPQLLLPGSDFLAVTGRHYWFSANAGGRLSVSARDILDFSGGAQRNVFRSGPTDSSFWTIPASIGYSRKINEQTDLGARVLFAYTDYDGPAKVWTVTPLLTANLRLSPSTTFSGGIGVTLASIENGVSTRHSTGLSANATLCNQGEFSSLCARASVDQQTATVAGPARSVSAGVDYTRKIDEGSSIGFAVEGVHYSRPITLISGPIFSTSDYYRAAVTYSRSIGRRLFGGVNLAARKLNLAGADPKADLSASLFVRYRFGDIR